MKHAVFDDIHILKTINMYYYRLFHITYVHVYKLNQILMYTKILFLTHIKLEINPWYNIVVVLPPRAWEGGKKGHQTKPFQIKVTGWGG